jgi:hypothetical protein
MDILLVDLDAGESVLLLLSLGSISIGLGDMVLRRRNVVCLCFILPVPYSRYLIRSTFLIELRAEYLQIVNGTWTHTCYDLLSDSDLSLLFLSVVYLLHFPSKCQMSNAFVRQGFYGLRDEARRSI